MNNMNFTATSSIKANETFLCWLQGEISGGYNPVLNITEMDDLVSKIVAFCEAKYPNRNSYVTYDGVYDFRGNALNERMKIEDLIGSLNAREQMLICDDDFQNDFKSAGEKDIRDEIVKQMLSSTIKVAIEKSPANMPLVGKARLNKWESELSVYMTRMKNESKEENTMRLAPVGQAEEQ